MRCRPTRVERDSVNSVALCDDQSLISRGDEGSEAGQTSLRMMVAASVHLNSFGTAYTARDTTIMPSIPSLLAIVAITFAPNAELRYVYLLTFKHFYCCPPSDVRSEIFHSVTSYSYSFIFI